MSNISEEERRGEERRKRGLNLVEVARALHLALLICNQTLSLSPFPTTSPDSVDGSWDKASILRWPRPLLVLFQATALRHRPFCMEHPKYGSSREREEERRKERASFGGRRGGEGSPRPLLLFVLRNLRGEVWRGKKKSGWRLCRGPNCCL